jgi:long-chain acyl-CoA synthetase
VVAPPLNGGCLTTMARFIPVRVVELLETGAITTLVAVPSVFAAIAALAERRVSASSFGGLRLAICGGAPLAADLQDRWFDLTGVELRQGYGLTEAGPVCLFNRVDLANRRGTLGVPFPGVQVSIRADDEAESPVGAEGEICVAGPNVFSGYVGVPERAARADDGWATGLRRSGGWLRTGDRGVRNADGTVSFRGLIKPMFTRNGFNIYPRELERVVGAMPGVSGVAVHAVPDSVRENDIVLEVMGDVTAADVKGWCDERLSVYKRPSSITIVAATDGA